MFRQVRQKREKLLFYGEFFLNRGGNGEINLRAAKKRNRPERDLHIGMNLARALPQERTYTSLRLYRKSQIDSISDKWSENFKYGYSLCVIP